MKVCSTCGDAYQDYVDFCFNDGEVLVEAEEGALGASLAPGMEATAAPRRTSATPGPSSMVATPVPRDHRRAGPRHGPRPGAEPQRGANVPHTNGAAASAVTVPDGDDAEDEGSEPSAASLEMTQPIEIGAQERGANAREPAPPSRPSGHAGQARAPTFDSEMEEPDSSRILLFGIVAALFGVVLLVAAGVVVVGMTTGLFATTPPADVVAAQPLPAPLPRAPLPSLVEPEPEPEAPVPSPEPLTATEAQPVPTAPQPASPEPLVAAAPLPVQPAPAPVLPHPVPAPSPVPPTPTVVPAPVVASAPRPAPVVAPVVTMQQVTLTTDPPGAAVYLRGTRVLAATPGTITLEPGTYPLEARLANHASSKASVTVVDAPVEARFEALAPVPMVRVTVMWAPGKDYPTEVTVDGARIACPIPCTTPMTAGAHTLRVVNLDGTTFESAVTIGAGPTQVVNLEPPPP